MEHARSDGLVSSFSAGVRVLRRVCSREHLMSIACIELWRRAKQDHVTGTRKSCFNSTRRLDLTPECHFHRGEHGNI
jgi:hypothetical protein